MTYVNSSGDTPCDTNKPYAGEITKDCTLNNHRRQKTRVTVDMQGCIDRLDLSHSELSQYNFD